MSKNALSKHANLVDMVLAGMMNEGQVEEVAAIAAVYLTLAAEAMDMTREDILKDSDMLRKRMLN